MTDSAAYRHTAMGLALVALVFLLYGLFLVRKQDITMADIGRHLRSGERLLQDGQLVRTNLYSYTAPDQPAVNHHWGAGALFYAVWKWTGFTGLHVFFAAVALLAFGIFYSLAIDHAGLGAASMAAAVIVPTLALRVEIRPEIFTSLFAGVFLWLLLNYRERKIPFLLLAIALPVLEIFWVNLHIYFPLGPAIIFAFLFESLIADRERTRKYLALLAFVSLATLFNPFGIDGAMAPFRIFENYGYPVIENQPVWVVDRTYESTYTIYFKAATILLAASYVAAAVRRPKDISLPFGLLAAGCTAAGWLAIRNFALFGLFSLPALAANIAVIRGGERTTRETALRLIASILLASAVALLISGGGGRFFPYTTSRPIGFGLETANSAAAEYIKKHDLRGPIFNNYDIGGYLIFHLYPRERVFVDNRPEAYPAAFFRDVYIPMQQRPELWNALSNGIFGFNLIVLSHRDRSPWLQKFLFDRLNDPEWSNVFMDHHVVIFVRKQRA